ncbi:MAG: catechol 2,3-dioxygenase-like lactoylglutathione lyase family enzyme [Zhongshania sp.]|jgi:catechol 2,3-dioxygenase-like lactoylglutathione lyase family enzyme
MESAQERSGVLEPAAMRGRCEVSEFDPAPRATASGLTHLRLARRDLSTTGRFLEDFGLSELQKSADSKTFGAVGESGPAVILEGQERDRFLGFGVRLRGTADFNALKESDLDTHCSPEGNSLSVRDPDGWLVHVGVSEHDGADANASIESANSPNLKARVNSVVSPRFGPAPVYRLGHVVLGVRDIEKSISFYQQNFGMRVSDFLFLNKDDTRPFQAFLRFDNGLLPCDHHSLALVEAPVLGLLHSAFEVLDFDAVATGGDYLQRRGHEHVWGIGRHTLGSNIFDYWRDPGGDLFEHFCDVDQFDARMSAGYHLLHKDSHHQWGPELTAEFLRVRSLPSFIREVVARLVFDKKFTLAHLRRVVRASNRKLS